MPDGSPFLTRAAVGVALAALTVVMTDAPSRLTGRVAGTTPGDLTQPGSQTRTGSDAGAQQQRFLRRLITGLAQGTDTLPEAASVLASSRPPRCPVRAALIERYPGLGAEARSAAQLVEIARAEVRPKPTRRRVVARLLVEYRVAFGEPSRLSELLAEADAREEREDRARAGPK